MRCRVCPAFLFLVLVAVTSPLAAAQECGDVAGDGDGVNASDALAVLRKAVGIDVDLQCVTGDCLALEARVRETERHTLVVRDADPKIIGTFVKLDRDDYGGPTVLLPGLAKLAHVVPLDNDPPAPPQYTIRGEWAEDVRYLLPDCQGDPLLSGNPDDLHTWTSEDAPTRHFALVEPVDGPITTASHLWGLGCENVVLETEASDRWWKAEEVALPLTLPITGPVQVEPLAWQ